MPFCPNDRSLLIPKEGKIQCPKCGYSTDKTESRIVTSAREEHEMLVLDDEARKKLEVMPIMRTECPQCGSMEAYYRTQQTRRSDEPETTFLRCKKCDHRWRKY